MYNILISISLGILVGVVYTLLGFWKTWAMGIILGVLSAVGAFALLSRMLARRIEPKFLQAQKQVQSGAHNLAIRSLEELLPWGRWQVLLSGQIYAQMGVLAYALEQDEKALGYLEKSGLRVPEAQLARAAILYRRKSFDEAYEVMELAIKANKKQILPYNAFAWMLEKQGDRAKAILQLQRCLKVEKSNESTKDNLLRLQNNKKLNMKRFGMQWYSLKLERPPASMAQMPPGMRRGFRGKQRKQKRRG
jgi:tetratricopeptide (TPR) repeat protein